MTAFSLTTHFIAAENTISSRTISQVDFIPPDRGSTGTITDLDNLLVTLLGLTSLPELTNASLILQHVHGFELCLMPTEDM